jgi:hypothetical protein
LPKEKNQKKGQKTLSLGPSDFPVLLARTGCAKTRPDTSGLKQSAQLIAPFCDARLRDNGLIDFAVTSLGARTFFRKRGARLKGFKYSRFQGFK